MTAMIDTRRGGGGSRKVWLEDAAPSGACQLRLLKMIVPAVGGELGQAGRPPHGGAGLPVVRAAGRRPNRRQVQPQVVGQRLGERLVQSTQLGQFGERRFV